MSRTHEAEVQFVSRRKSDVDYLHNYPSSDAPDPDAADYTATVGFQAHYSFLPGFAQNLLYPFVSTVSNYIFVD